MANSILVWQWLLDRLDANQAVGLLIVTDSTGSSPGKMGAKMAIDAESAIGTIGGGMIEADLTKTARFMLLNGNTEPRIVRRAHHPSKTTQTSGMICGGEQTVLIYPCHSSDKVAFRQLLENRKLGKLHTLAISEQGLKVLPNHCIRASPVFHDGEAWHYQENIGLNKQAFIIGGGHVGLALSKILNTLNFDITVIDSRDPPETLQANNYARNKWRMAYANIEAHIPEGEDVFVFIMTHSHQQDELVLKQLFDKRLAYLGLLGSRHKIEAIRQTLAGQVMSERQWQAVHAPMGLAIGSHSPEEIAISIGAEVVQVLNNSRQ